MSTESSLFQKFGKTFKKGSTIFQEEEKGEHLYIIQEGEVNLTKNFQGEERFLAVLGKGEFLGEMSIFSSNPRTATATAKSEVKLIVIDQQTFETMIRDNKEIALRIIKKLVSRLEVADERIDNLMVLDPMNRITGIILKYATKQDDSKDKKEQIDIDLKPPDLAAWAGLDENLVIQLLKKMKKSGVITDKSGKIRIPNLGVLEKYMKYLDLKSQFDESDS
jgi:CRP-like cAMP-binding protein